MLFVVEGVDRTGKSTLCDRLEERCRHPDDVFMPGHSVERLHFSAPQKDALEEYLAPIADYRPGANEDVVVDRHYLGELVWPEIFGREPRMTRLECSCIESFLKLRGALCVWAWRDPIDLEEACVDEPCAGKARYAQELFDGGVSRSILRWRFYTHGDTIEDIVLGAKQAERDATWNFPSRRI